MPDYLGLWRDILAQIKDSITTIIQGLNSGSYTINGSSITGDISGNSIPWGAAGYPVDVAATEADGTAITAARSDHRHALGIMTTLGDILYSVAAGVATRLAGNTTATRKFLRQTGDGAASAAPAWDTLIAADYPTMIGDAGAGGTKGAVPAPAAGDAAKYLRGDGTWTTAGGDVATDAIWDAKGDLAAGTGANTAARLPVGADGKYLKAASGEATGLMWDTPAGSVSAVISAYALIGANASFR